MILFNQEAFQAMIADAKRAFPDECCGFMLGTEAEGVRTIISILAVHNAKEGDKRRRFEISAKDYLKGEAFADEAGLQLLGIYHSHPQHPAIPSEHDRVAAQPYFSYVILSIMEGELDHIRSWTLTDDFQFREENIQPQSIIQKQP